MPGTVVTGSPIPALTGSIRINMGAIVGGAVGGWCFFAFALLFLFFYNLTFQETRAHSLPI